MNNYNDSNSLELIKSFFNHIRKRMPKYIASEQSNQINFCLNNINNKINELEENIKRTSVDSFEEKFQLLIDEVNNYINKPNQLYELNPLWHELVDVKNNSKILWKDIQDKNNNLLNSFYNEENLETIYLAKKQINKMLIDFNFKSVQVSNGSSWEEVYDWAKTTYIAIEKAQNNIGLENHHAGVNQSLNLVFNPESLSQSRGNGKMFANMDCNTIVLNSFHQDIQITIWQHEYAHVLDNRVGIKLAKSYMDENQMHSCMFLSQLEMERQLAENSYSFSDDLNLSNAQVWMTEAISDAVCGSSSETLKDHHVKCSIEFSRTLAENLLIQCLGEIPWATLEARTKDGLLSNPIIINYVDNIAEDIYKKGVIKFSSNYWNYEKNTQEFKSICSMVKESVTEHENILEHNFKENLTSMSWNFFDIMNKYYYSHTNNQKYFSKSKTAMAASQHSLKFITPYHTKSLEIFARSCEDLQRPLIMSTQEYFMEKEKETIQTENFLNPTLNRNERIVFISTLHALVKALGMEVNKKIEDLPALKELIINQGSTSYSSMSENEIKAFEVLEKASKKVRLQN